MPDEENKWQQIYERFLANEHIGRISGQVGLPKLESEEQIELFFTVLGDRGNKLNKSNELAQVLGMTAKKTKLVISTLRDAVEGQSWNSLREKDDIRKTGWKPER